MSNVPKLRFKEFSGEWSKNKTNIKIVSGNTYPLDAYSKEGTLLVQGLNIYPNELQLDNPIYISDSYITGKDVFVNKEDILLGLNRPIIGKKLKACLFRKDRAVLYQRAGILDFDKSKLSNRFLFQYLFTPSFLKQLLAELVGSDQPYIKSDLFKVTKNLFPSKQEQEKIASFLTSIDSKIEQLTKKESLLQEYKKGVMQKIFNQEIRFKADDGSEFCEWEEKELGEIFKRVVSKNKENNKNVLTISAQQGLINQEEFFNKSVSAKDITNYYLISKNDFAYNKSYSNGYPMGAIKKLNRYEKGVVSTLYICFRILNGNYSADFYEKYFDSGLFNREIEKIAQEGARNHGLLNVSVVDFFSSTILPCPSIEEQIKIANFLSSIDKKIENTRNELEKTKEFKKALLQQMFL